MICKKCGRIMGYTISSFICGCGNVSFEGIKIPVYSDKGDVRDIILHDDN